MDIRKFWESHAQSAHRAHHRRGDLMHNTPSDTSRARLSVHMCMCTLATIVAIDDHYP